MPKMAESDWIDQSQNKEKTWERLKNCVKLNLEWPLKKNQGNV